MPRRRDVEEAARVAKDNDCKRRAQEKEETSFSVQSSMIDEILVTATKKDEGEILRDVEEIVAYVTADKYREMDEAVDRAFAQYGRILGTTVSEARVKFEA